MNTTLSMPEQAEFCKRMQQIAGSVFSYKTAEHGAVWQAGQKRLDKRKLVQRMNRSWFRHDRMAQKHFKQVAPNLKITNTSASSLKLKYFDVDCKNSNSTPERCREFLVSVQKHCPFLAHLPEPVINERGGCLWLLVNTQYQTIADWNKLIEAMSRWLKDFATVNGYDDFSEVEVYGTVPEPVCSKFFKGEVVDLKMDSRFLFKCPPSIEWVNRAIKYEQVKEFLEAEKLKQESGKLKLLNVKEIGQFRELANPKVFKSPGSTREDYEPQIKHIERQIMHLDKPAFVQTGKKKRWMSNRTWAEYIHAIIIARPCPDGAMPHWSIVKLIQSLKNAGIYNSYGDPSILTAVRNWMSDRGMIQWIDNRFSKGMACKWSIKPEVRKDMKDKYPITSLSSVVSTSYSSKPIRPVFLCGIRLPDNWQDHIEALPCWKREGF